jgi:peptidoglycan/LPS O-acetylase OafA/YrhL
VSRRPVQLRPVDAAQRHLGSDIWKALGMANPLGSTEHRIFPTQLLAEKKHAEPKLRLNILDSIRGWAAIGVLVFHVSHEMFADKLPEFGAYWPAFLQGPFAVAIFFVVSGEALSHGYFVKNDIEAVRKLAIKRYVRLTVPIFVSCLIVLLLMKNHLIFSHEAALIVDQHDWLGHFLLFDPGIASFLSYSLYGVYFPNPTETSYNPVLWSMSVEMPGSLFVFFTLFVTRTRAQRWAIYAVTSPFMIVFSPFLICFIFGMIFSEMRVAGTFNRLAARSATNWVCGIALIGVVTSLTASPLLPFAHTAVAHRFSLAAAVFLFAIYSSNRLQTLFDNRFSHFLGEISFPVYLVHLPIVVSLESYLILRLCADGIVTRGPAYFIIVVTLAASLFAGLAFVYVERFAIKASNSFFALFNGM